MGGQSRRAGRDVVVRCEGEGHRVRLAGGRRLLASARCPTCGQPVDPRRLFRLRALAALLLRPASPHLLDRAVWAASLSVLGVCALAAALLVGFADRWWPATLLLFGPRWLLLAPIPPVAAVAAFRDRLLFAPLALSAWLALGPVMGFETGWRAWLTRPDPARDLTVVTFNAAGGWPILQQHPGALMRAWDADVAAVQECGSYALEVALRDLQGWHTYYDGNLCLISRFEIMETLPMERDVLESVGGSGLVVSFRLAGDDGPFWLTNVHLETAGDALRMIRDESLLHGITVLGRVTRLREVEHRRARRFVGDRRGPHIVLGDFNTPPESRLQRTEWRGWTNAFSRAGVGVGATRVSGWVRSRIDHVLVDDEWRVVSAHVGEPIGSDHLPMLATVRPR